MPYYEASLKLKPVPRFRKTTVPRCSSSYEYVQPFKIERKVYIYIYALDRVSFFDNLFVFYTIISNFFSISKFSFSRGLRPKKRKMHLQRILVHLYLRKKSSYLEKVL